MQSLLHIKYYPSISILQVKYYPSLAGTYVAFTAGAVFTAGNVLPSILQVNYYSTTLTVDINMQSLLQVKYYSSISILQIKYYPSLDGRYRYAVVTTVKVLPQYQYIASKVLPQYRGHVYNYMQSLLQTKHYPYIYGTSKCALCMQVKYYPSMDGTSNCAVQSLFQFKHYPSNGVHLNVQSLLQVSTTPISTVCLNV